MTARMCLGIRANEQLEAARTGLSKSRSMLSCHTQPVSNDLPSSDSVAVTGRAHQVQISGAKRLPSGAVNHGKEMQKCRTEHALSIEVYMVR